MDNMNLNHDNATIGRLVTVKYESSDVLRARLKWLPESAHYAGADPISTEESEECVTLRKGKEAEV